MNARLSTLFKRSWILPLVIPACLLTGGFQSTTFSEEPYPLLRRQTEQAVRDYQLAFAEENPASRVAAFRNVEIAFSSLFLGENNQPLAGTDHLKAGFFVCWGNAAIQAGKQGHAVYAFRKALLLEPNHQQARKNLDFIQQQLPAWTQPADQASPLTQQLFFWNRASTRSTVLVLAASLFAAGCLLIALSIGLRKPPLRTFALVPMAAWVLLAISFCFGEPNGGQSEVVFIQEESRARTADAINASASFAARIPEGAQAKIIDDRGEWIQVEFANSQQGWVQQSDVFRLH